MEVPREPILQLTQRKPGEPLALENLSPEALEILANIKRKAQGKKGKQEAKRERKEKRREAEKMLSWRTYRFFLGRKVLRIAAPSVREAQRIAVETYGPEVWPQTDFD